MSSQELEQLIAEKGRPITNDEIEDIVGSFGSFPSTSKTVREFMREKLQDRVRLMLRDKIIIDEIYQDFKKEILHALEQSYISPGESVGTIAAGAVSAPATQMKLSAYHLIGIGGGDSLKSLVEIVVRSIDRQHGSEYIHY